AREEVEESRMSEFYFVVGDKSEGPIEIYASVVANDAAAAAERLRTEIDGLVGDRAGIEISVEDDRVTRFMIGINTRRISEDDVVTVDDEHALRWTGEEIRETLVSDAGKYEEKEEVNETAETEASETFRLIINQRQSNWEPRQGRGLRFRVASKGGVSVYGLNRFPVTLYYEQWLKLFEVADDLRRFIEDNKANLKRKVGQ